MSKRRKIFKNLQKSFMIGDWADYFVCKYVWRAGNNNIPEGK